MNCVDTQPADARSRTVRTTAATTAAIRRPRPGESPDTTRTRASAATPRAKVPRLTREPSRTSRKRSS